MLNSKYYIPILKWKRAEQNALKTLTKERKKYITPLIQFVMPKAKPNEQFEETVTRFEKQLLEIPNKIINVWGTTAVFVDVSLLFTTSLKVKSLKTIVQKGNKLGGTFIPVIHLHDEDDIKEKAFFLARQNNRGLCIRLVCPDFLNQNKLNQDIARLLLSSKLKEKDIDLLVDIKETNGGKEKYIKYLNLSQNILNIKKWRTFILAASSFPEDLTKCWIDEENLLPRIEWKCFKDCLTSSNLQRKPIFADYTIQHPVYKEATQFFHPSSSIKYTLANHWLILKGKKQEFGMYLASAAELVKDKRFYGENFSDGDKYIVKRAKHYSSYIKNPEIKGTGSAETWLRAGINHHLELVVNQIANLP